MAGDAPTLSEGSAREEVVGLGGVAGPAEGLELGKDPLQEGERFVRSSSL